MIDTWEALLETFGQEDLIVEAFAGVPPRVPLTLEERLAWMAKHPHVIGDVPDLRARDLRRK